MQQREIKDQSHYNNLVQYIKKKTVIFEDERIEWTSGRKAIFDKTQEIKEITKNSTEVMAHFRAMYTEVDSWKKNFVRLGLAITGIKLQNMEDQRIKEDRLLPLSKSELKRLMHKQINSQKNQQYGLMILEC